MCLWQRVYIADVFELILSPGIDMPWLVFNNVGLTKQYNGVATLVCVSHFALCVIVPTPSVKKSQSHPALCVITALGF